MRDFNHFLFYSEQINGKNLLLDSSETHHAVNVLRLEKGEKFKATDGKGRVFTCIADSIENGIITGIITDKKLYKYDTCFMHVITGIADKECFEKAVIECTALGIGRITPVISEHSQKAWWKNSWEKHNKRFRKKMISAIKQSLFPFIPVLDPPVTMNKITLNNPQKVFVADPNGLPLQTIPAKIFQGNSVKCIIGPPGGFSEKEINFFKEKQLQFIKIGPNRLRTELAIVVLCAQIIGRCL